MEVLTVKILRKKLTFLSIEEAKNADANGLMEFIISDFKWFDKAKFQNHILNDQLELAVKDSFKTTTFFKIDKMLKDMYQNSRLKHQCQQNGSIIRFELWKLFSKIIRSLSQMDSQEQKRAQLQEYVTIWKHETYPLHMAIYLDILSHLRRLSLGFQ